MDKELQLFIHHKDVDSTAANSGKWYKPAILDDVAWELNLRGSPGKLTFKVVKDATLNFIEGDEVRASYGGTDFFFGFVFIKKHGKDSTISVTAYDQLRYLKNKDTFSYKSKKASEVIKELAEDFELKIGELDDTGFVIEKRRESNATIFDMMQNALDLTMVQTKKIYALYDDVGKLMLKDIEKLKLKLLIDAETAQDYAYESSIDKDTYNLVKLVVDDKQQGAHQTFYAPEKTTDYKKSKTRKQWGVLQYYESINGKSKQSPQERANKLLELHNRVKRTLSIKGAFGDIRVRAGSMIYVSLALGDIKLEKQVIVENVKHKFSNGQYEMDLKVKGDVISK